MKFQGAGGGIWTIGDKTVRAGTDGDIPIPADYFNEGKKRLAVFRPSNGNWYAFDNSVCSNNYINN